MNKSHDKLEQDMKRLEIEKEREQWEFEKQIQKYQSNSEDDSSDEDGNNHHNHQKPHHKPTIQIIKVCGKSQPIYHQSESANLQQCPLYGSASKQSLIPQVILASSLPLHTVVEED